MADYLRSTSIYCGDLVAIHDVACRPNCHRCSGVECSSSATVTFLCRGTFVRHRGRREELIDPIWVVFFLPDYPLRVSHPVAGGDDCTSLCYSLDVLCEALIAHGLLDCQVRDVCPVRTNAPISPATQALFRQVRNSACRS